jgi:hypothetical protein
VVVFFVACSNNNNGTKQPMPDSPATINEKVVDSNIVVNKIRDTALEGKITDALMKISFVAKTNKYLDSLTGHKHGIAFIVDSVGANEISVMAGYNGPDRFETYYNFTVYPKTFDIMIDDPETGELVPIEQYIKLKKG